MVWKWLFTILTFPSIPVCVCDPIFLVHSVLGAGGFGVPALDDSGILAVSELKMKEVLGNL